MTKYQKRISDLRKFLDDFTLDGYIQPYADAWHNHFVPEQVNRLRWLTGFTGSAGIAAVTKDKAVLLSDSRYTIQMAQEVDSELFETADMTKRPIENWITDNLTDGSVIGYDPALLTIAQREKIENKLKDHDITLHAVTQNPVDSLWERHEAEISLQPARMFTENISGCSADQKIKDMAHALQNQSDDLDFYIISDPTSLSWMLNVRGGDVAYLPVVLSYALLNCQDETITWFIEEDRVAADIQSHIGPSVTLYSPDTLDLHLKALSGRVGLSQDAPDVFMQILKESNADLISVENPATKLMAVKTQAEQDSMRAVHIQDGLAVTRLLHWLSKQPVGSLYESDIAAQFEICRHTTNSYYGPSFPHIIGYDANGAIVHYTLEEGEKGAHLNRPSMLLMDTGGQYEGGTTDITRTVFYGDGAPTAEMKHHFTLVLKGHIALAQARFPKGTTGAQVDTLARKALWAEGLDYGHGTGHGVGTALDVHEPSANIHARGHKAFEPGMIITNEPGYYLEGAYGIRTENILIVRENETDDMLSFETITLAPIDRALIEIDLLEATEKDWLNTYHKRVYETLSPYLEEDVKGWLKDQTAAL